MLGWGAPAPLLTEMQELLEEHRPHSPDPAFWDVWSGRKNCTIDWKEVAENWSSPAQSEDDAQASMTLSPTEDN
ncbi:MAG: hypothetical protein F4065_09525 [Rhodothermaceae bacterium]|nr:hypothetical protein [Rhodothermaceae bacterium]MXZ57244.1 hypothetical protein [Rhodothermaceae bacterium]MYB90940.1 hypothetical protein [Rhodothermaceae bacterium]MYD67815.1 hypothetical protein [Rhodothermaceae bacterium]MYG45110.1 hypothetical protein [Rhodothermaceae bacterium]